MLLYTEKQLRTAYKTYIRDYCPANKIPDIEVFRSMFESSYFIQSLCEKEVSEH
tara:strand:+ start:928 stop:1089 length:162 start_codon:yes stop_codon:yes gene_type:complete